MNERANGLGAAAVPGPLRAVPVRLYVPRAMALIAAFPNRATDFPDPAQLVDAAASAQDSDLPAHLQEDVRDGLRALARSVEAALAGKPLPHVEAPKPQPAPIRRMA